MTTNVNPTLSIEPQWYKDAIIYELHVRAFCDSVGDGVGDFRGVTQHLDYIQDLGVTAIWLLPFYPSPLRDDGYDIADYLNVHPSYGTVESFRELLDAAHARGLRVITELVLNHTSDQHPWFQRARRSAPGSSARDFYVWSHSPDKYSDARVIFRDYEVSNWTFDRVAGAYYWHRFYSHQPDLNFDNPDVWQALMPVIDFWFEMGVDGMRLDAIPYLFEREGTSCENLPETHAFLRTLRRHIDEKFEGRMLLAEANQWPEEAIDYFGKGDECHMAFHFPLMPRLFMGIQMQDRFPIVDILEQTPPIPDNCQWALFLRNHDELTLEMVTDKERDYMYRSYSDDRQARINVGIRRRLAPLLGNNRRRIELINGLLLSLPGTPVIYYGDEIGMGDNIYLGDRNGVRTPMQWSADRNAGFSRSNPQKLYLPVIVDPEYHYEAINVEAQQGNPHSLLWWMKRLLGLRRQHRAFSRGTIEFLQPHNRRILAYLRRHKDESLMVVANLSRFVQYVELDLSAFEGIAPVEMFGGTEFPRIGKLPYLLTLGPYSFYWFMLGSQVSESHSIPPRLLTVKSIRVQDSWIQALAPQLWSALSDAIRVHLVQNSSLQRNGRLIRSARILDVCRLPCNPTDIYLTLCTIEFNEGESEMMALPITYASPELADSWNADNRPPLIAELNGGDNGVLVRASLPQSLGQAFLNAMATNARLVGHSGGEICGSQAPSFIEVRGTDDTHLAPMPVSLEQRNESVTFGERMILKAYRRIERGPHPEVEFGRLLQDNKPSSPVARLLGTIEYRRRTTDPITLAVLHEYVPNEGDAWQYALDALSDFYERVATLPESTPIVSSPRPPWKSLRNPLPDLAAELIGSFHTMAGLLGRRLGELHIALATCSDEAAFAPEEFTPSEQRSTYQSLRNQTLDLRDRLRHALPQLNEPIRRLADELLSRESELISCFRRLLDRRFRLLRIRCLGDCHLGQVLFTGKDFVFIDLEGQSDQSIGERRAKRSPICDVAELLRSFSNAALSNLQGLSTGRGRLQGVIRAEDISRLRPWAGVWYEWVSHIFVSEYCQTVSGREFVPESDDERHVLFSAFVLERAIQNLNQALWYRPEWVPIAISGVLSVLSETDLQAVGVQRELPPIVADISQV